MGDARAFGLEVLAQAGITVGGHDAWDLQIHDERFWDRVLRDREVGLGESYVERWWDCDRIDQFMSRVICSDLRSQIRPSADLVRLAVRSKLANRQSSRRAKDNAESHYNIGNDLYERMLDKRMIYTCGYWRSAETLGEAQEAKLDLICRKLGFEPGMTVLDIGCGWGGFAQFAAERYGVKATGVSPASEQVKLARQRTAGLDVEIVEADYRDVRGSFDRIVSIGMFEHVGPKNYDTFFAKCDELLAPDGLMLHHTIGGLESNTVGDPWFDKYIFPGGVLPSLTQIAAATELDWVIEEVHNFGPDYDRTLMAWLDNIDASWHEIPSYDEEFQRMWRYYLMLSAATFRSRSSQLWQIVFSRSRRESPTFATIR